MEKIIIKSLKADAKIEGCLLVKTIDEKLAKTGNPYYLFVLTDGETDISGIYFTPKPLKDYKALQGKVICFTLETQIYNDKFSCKVISFDINTKIDDGIKQSFLKFSFKSDLYPFYKTELDSLIQSIEDLDIQKLCKHVFLEKYYEDFISYPAAKLNHHAGFAGLLEHSINLARIALFFATYYQYDHTFNRDLLIAGALFQDVGKIDEFDVDSFFNANPSKIGKLKGHPTIGNEILYSSLSELGINPKQDKFSYLSHIILSHHGELEYGAAAQPCTPEAMLISRIDKLDADMKATIMAVHSTREGEDYTAKIFSLGNRSIMMPNVYLHEITLTEKKPNMEIIEDEVSEDPAELF